MPDPINQDLKTDRTEKKVFVPGNSGTINYRKLFTEMLEGFCLHEIICDENGRPVNYRFLEMNPAFEKLTGMDAQTTIGKTVLEIMPDLEPYWIETYGQVALTGKSLHFDNYSKAINKHYHIAAYCPLPGQFAVLFTDITERVIADEKVRLLNTQLNKLVEEIQHRIEERTEQLEFSNKELEAFSYSVSHDLKAPLRAIDGYSMILLDDYENVLDNEGKKLLKNIRNNSQRMATLITNLLEFSQLSRSEIMRTPINMEKQARSIFEEITEGKSTSDIEFKLSNIPSTQGDAAMMDQVWMNLLSNAIKYSATKEHPCIEIGATIQKENVTYYVHDNGIGFDMKYYNKLFGVFQRLHAASDYPGTGVGLALVQRIIHKHGGRVWAESKVMEGATFYFTLPR